jgi:ubiquinone/menaquinone biosynthesis C-methylase UbiE
VKKLSSLVVGVVAFATALGTVTASHAQLASRAAAEWIKTLEAPDRVAGLKIDEVVARLSLKSGDVVADLGAGSGLFALPLAKAVGTGKVYAVELDEGFLDRIREKTREARIGNVVPVRGQFTDPALPAMDVTLGFFHDVLHHVENRAAYVKSVARYIRPGGRIVVIEFDPAQSPHRDQPELVVSKEQTRAWMAEAGFVPSEEVALFPDKWFVIYTRR